MHEFPQFTNSQVGYREKVRMKPNVSQKGKSKEY